MGSFTSLPIPTATIGVGAANRAALAATSTAYGAVYLMEVGREGTFVFSSSNLSTQVTNDTQQGIYVAPSSDATGASGAWVRSYGDSPVNVRWFGTASDDSTDDLPAFNAALAYLKTTVGPNPTPKLFIPATTKTYFLSGPLNVHFTVHIYGVGCANGNINGGSLLRFAQNQWGIVFHEFRTLDNGGGNASTPSGLGDASGSILEGVSIWGGAAQSLSGPFTNPSNTNRNATGVWPRCFSVTVRDVACAFFGGPGFLINATSGSTGSTAGQANLFRFEKCQAEFNAMDGFSISGNDANAGVIDACSAISNGACGFREYSFLGNTYIQCHTRANGLGDPTGSGALGGTCGFMGQSYYIPGSTNAGTQQTLASTTTPGTNSAVWAPFSAGGSTPTWTTGQTWTVSGPYVTGPGNVNAKNVFLGCYAELSQPPSQSTTPTLWVGGAVTDLGFDTSGTPGHVVSFSGIYTGWEIFANMSGSVSTPGTANLTINYGTGSDISAPGRTVISAQDSTQGHSWQWLYDGTSELQLFHDHSTLSEIWGLANNSNPYSHTFLNFLLGNSGGNIFSSQRFGSIDQGSDLNTKSVLKGDMFFYTGRGSGNAGMGQICLTAGTVGSTATMAEFGVRNAPARTVTGSTDTIGTGDTSVIYNAGGTTTITLPSASSESGRWVFLRTIASSIVGSANSDVVPLAGGSASTAILAGTPGKWAALQSDGSAWQIMMSN